MNHSYARIFSVLMIFSTLSLFISCSDEGDTKSSTSTTTTTTTTTTPTTPSGNTGDQAGGGSPEKTAHYVCPDYCVGSGSDNAGNCPVCGKEYIHNDGFHAQENQQQPDVQITSPDAPEKPSVDVEELKKKGPEYIAHYTCPNYCKGSGSSDPGNCPTCGSEYLHNDAFHQL